ncbi:MAG: T9SS type A sorting domain-containing protein [Flavobacteriales bacterium]
MSQRYPVATVLSFLFITAAQAQYSGPESVEYDAVGDRYFVSNTSNGKIRQRDQAGTVTDFVTVSPAPYGIEIMDTVIYACSGGTVKGYGLLSGVQVFNLNLGANFLNGITTDGTYLYVTDFGNDDILKVDVANTSFTLLVSLTTFTPNGIVYDPIEDRLVVVAWSGSAPITAVDKNTGALTTLTTTSLSNIDGITIDCLGRFITADWGSDHLTAFAPDFLSPGVNLGATGIANPADLDFDEVHGLVCVPNTSTNTVSLFGIVGCISGVLDEQGTGVLSVVPNPTEGVVSIVVPPGSDRRFVLRDATGRLVLDGTLPASNLMDLSDLKTGHYIISFPGAGRSIPVVRR